MAIVFFGEPDTHGVSDALQVLDGSGLYVRTASGEELGVVRPDGTSITIDADGTIHGVTGQSGQSGPRWEVRTDADGNRRLAIVIPEDD